MDLAGAAALTFFCGVTDPDAVTAVISGSIGSSLAGDWMRASLSLDGRDMTVNRRLFSPNSEFSGTILGLQNALRTARHISPTGVEQAVDLLYKCDVMLGTVFTPVLADRDARSAVAGKWAVDLRAAVFDGQFLMNDLLEPVAEIRPV